MEAVAAEKVIFPELDGGGDGDILTGGIEADAAGTVVPITALASSSTSPPSSRWVMPFGVGCRAARTDDPSARWTPCPSTCAQSTHSRCSISALFVELSEFLCQSSISPVVLCVRGHRVGWK